MTYKYKIGVRHFFYPVGQGLFGVGQIGPFHHECWVGNDHAHFDWVYDCGSTSTALLLQSQIDRFVSGRRSAHPIGLVTLSHFDADHVNGVVALLSRCKVDVLLLPFVSFARRIQIGISEGLSAASPLWRFLLDPVTYLKSADIVGVERLVFVLPSGSEGPFLAESQPNGDPNDKDQWKLRFDAQDQPLDTRGASGSEGHGSAGGTVSSVSYLAPGNSLRLHAAWEFVPYNDARLARNLDSLFLRHVAKAGDALLNAASDTSRRQLLSGLKAIYDRKFGSSSKARNEISLFLYGGPLEAAPMAVRLYINGYPDSYGWNEEDFRDEPSGAFLYSGDAFLDTNRRLHQLVQFLSRNRMQRISIFQVMHHGSRRNWHAGVARQIGSTFNVFSSDPNRGRDGHPHAEVLRDFWMHQPVQVDQSHSAEFLTRPLLP